MNIKTWLALPLAALALSGCGGGGSSDAGTPSVPVSMGTLRVGLTDAPACGFDHVYVTVQKLSIHTSATAGDNDAGWTDLAIGTAQRLDLLTLRNGVLASLGQTPLPTGHYAQLRMQLAENSGNTLANSVVPTGGSEVALKTPSGQQSGVKLSANIDIAANQLADVVLDFDACKSVVTAGASNQYLLKPVVAVIPNLLSGVTGYVDASVASGSTSVSLQQGGVVLKATSPDATGKFTLVPVAPGTYEVVVKAPGRATTVVSAVPVTASTVTALNTSTAPLTPAVAAEGKAVGTVMATGAGTSAAVAATQKLIGGLTITVAEAMSDSVTGAYTLTLPAAAPRVAQYAAAPALLVFNADNTAGAAYTLNASLNGTTKTAGPFTVTAAGTLTTNFGF